MRSRGMSYYWSLCLVAFSVVAAERTDAQPPSQRDLTKVGDTLVADVIHQLGAKLESGTATKELDEYSIHFERMDANRDGNHTWEEYVENGRYMTPQARAGIFRAADSNADGIVNNAEYVLNRIITDEGKAIVQGMDDDHDGLVERAEFIKHSTKLLSDRELAEQVFFALDANADGRIPIPEYLRVWGRWARVGRESAAERIAARRKELAAFGETRQASETCPACATGLTAEFVFNRLDVNEDRLVTVNEFRRSPGMDDEVRAREVVGRLDKTGDGMLSWQELKSAFDARHANCKKSDPATLAANAEQIRPDGRGDGSRFAQVFILRSDSDGDGKVSKDEFRGAGAGFDRLDQNRNGFIEADELGGLHQQRLKDPKSMRERIQSGDVPNTRQNERPNGLGDVDAKKK